MQKFQIDVEKKRRRSIDNYSEEKSFRKMRVERRGSA